MSLSKGFFLWICYFYMVYNHQFIFRVLNFKIHINKLHFFNKTSEILNEFIVKDKKLTRNYTENSQG